MVFNSNGMGYAQTSHRWNKPLHCKSSSQQITSTRGKSRVTKKAKRVRTAFTESQLVALEARYKEQKYISKAERGSMALQFGIGDKQIKIWFQNRRMKEKKGQTNNDVTSTPSVDSNGMSDLSDIDILNLEIPQNNAEAQSETYMLPEHLQYQDATKFLDHEKWEYANWNEMSFVDTGYNQYPQSYFYKQAVYDNSCNVQYQTHATAPNYEQPGLFPVNYGYDSWNYAIF